VVGVAQLTVREAQPAVGLEGMAAVEDRGGGGGADDNEESRAEAIPLEREHHSTFYLLGCYSHTHNKN
jgi:hypothetical protein